MGRFFGNTNFRVGDRVVFRLTRHAVRPGIAARNVTPSEKGEGYSYVVNKFWVVVATNKSKSVLVRTRRGKLFEIDRTDTRLRRASWLECLFARGQFPRRENATIWKHPLAFKLLRQVRSKRHKKSNVAAA